VSLERELELLRRYVEIQQFRFSDRLRVELAVDPRARRALVPSFLLQPLVENSIHHGIAPRASGGSVRVLVEREGDTVLLTVTDDGIGAGAGGRMRRSGDGVSGASGGGVGLGNTRARLRHLYGDAHRFEAGARPEGGFEVHIEIPFRDAAESPSPAILEVVA
jgi:sensor histidine kinase YesM